MAKEQKSTSTARIQQEIEDQSRWPAGGLKELRSRHEAGWAYFDSLVALRQAGCQLEKSQLAFAFRYTVASLYACEENARAMAIEEVLLTGNLVLDAP